MTIMKIFIALLILAFALPVHSSYAVSQDRAMFMCSVGTAECPDFKPVKFIAPELEQPLEVKRAPEPMISATSTTAEAEKIVQMKALIEQLRSLLEQLKAMRAHEVS